MGYSDLGERQILGRIFLALEENGPPAWVSDCGMYVTSDQAIETHRGLQATPALREWLGGRQAKRLGVDEQIVVNKRYEATLEVSRQDLRRDKLGQIQIRINELAQRAANHWTKLVTEQIEANSTTYDGLAFFASGHSGGSNDLDLSASVAAAGGTPTAAEAEAIVMESLEAMYSLVDDESEPMSMDVSQITIMVPVNMYGPFQRALNDAVITDGSGTRTNTLLNLGGINIRLAVNPRLTSASKLYVFRSDRAQKALILQEEVTPKVEVLGEGSDFAFNYDAHQYGISKSCGIANGIWQYAQRITLS